MTFTYSPDRDSHEKNRPKFGHILLMLMCMALAISAYAQSSRFDVFHKNKIVGEVFADRMVNGDQTNYVMTSRSEFWILWTQTMRSYAETQYTNGQLNSCYTSFRLNGSLRDSSNMEPKAGVHHCYVDPNERFVHNGSVEWTTARLYFEEPVGLSSVFVESALKVCPMTLTMDHSYRVELPDGNANTYKYSRGILQEILVERRLVDLIFRRSTG